MAITLTLDLAVRPLIVIAFYASEALKAWLDGKSNGILDVTSPLLLIYKSSSDDA